MKKIYSFLLSLLVMTVWSTKVSADIVDNYSYQFEGLQTYNLPKDWAPAGWGHIIDSYDGAYVSYRGMSSGGVDDSGCLSVGSQSVGSDYWDSQDVCDILVTPKVSGHVTIMFKSTSYYSGDLKLYNVTEEGGKFKKGALITTATIPSPIYNEWVTAEIDLTDYQHVGIYANSACLDNFSAAKADIVKKPALSIKNVTAVYDEKQDCTPENKFTVQYKVKVQNTGLLDLNPGDENYSLSIVKNDAPDVAIVTEPITQALPINAESDEITITATLSYEEYKGRLRYDVKENVSGNTSYGSWVDPTPYAPVLTIKDGDKNDVLAESTVEYGMQNKVTTKTFSITNDGAAPMNITDIIMPEGFTTTLTATTFKPHATVPFDIVMAADAAGTKEGTMTIKGEGIADFTINLKGEVVDPTKYFENFESGKFAVNMITDADWKMSSFPHAIGLSGNQYCAMEDNSTDNQKLITPLLEVAAGDKFTFLAGKTTTSGCHLNIYYSTDRKTWTNVRTLSVDAENEADKFPETKVGASYSSNYEMALYELDNIPAGQYYLAFEAGGVHLDNLYGFKPVAVNHDLIVTENIVPESVMTNHSLKVTATFKNVNLADEPTGSYTAALHFGDDIIKTDAPVLKAGETQTFTFLTTPHVAGDVKTYVELKGDDFSVKTDEATVKVVPEVADNSVQVGAIETATTDAPLCPYYKNTVSELLYTAEDINLPEGSQITSIEFRGYNSKESKYASLAAYVANTDDVAFADPFVPADVTTMTKVYDDSYAIPAAGQGENSTYGASVTVAGSLLKITFPTPLVYNGKSLRVVFKGVMEGYTARIAWEASSKEMAKAANSDYSIETATMTATNLPVAYFGVVKDPVILTGTVTDAETGNALKDVKLLAKSGDVEYYATTGEDGKYSMEIIQDSKTYSVKATLDGYAPSKVNEMTFAEGNTVKDFTMGKANGFFIDEQNLPVAGNVNDEYTATVKAMNPEATDINADAYTAKLYFGENVMAEAQAQTVKAGETADFKFSFYPHQTGTYNAHVEYVYGEKKTIGETVSVTIGDEITAGSLQIGDSTACDNSSLPLSTFFRNSESDMVYTAAQLGINKGTIINRIRMRGYVLDGYSSSKKTVNANIRVYIANADEESLNENTYELPDTLQMTKVFDARQQLTEGMGSDKNPLDLIDLQIEGGFKYTGKSLRIFVHHDADGYVRSYFVTDANKNGQAMYRANDSAESASYTWKNGDGKGMPVLYMDVTSSAEVSGKITDKKNQPVAGAAVTLKSGGVEYYATSAEDGTYSLTVGKIALTYSLGVKADNFVEYTAEGISFLDELKVNADAVLSAYSTVSGAVLGKKSDESDAAAKALQGVEVKLTSEDGTVSETATTDAEGKYKFDILDINGKYTLTFTMDGYNDKSVDINGEYADINVPNTILEAIASGINTVGNNGFDLGTADVKVFTLNGEKVSEGVGAAASLPRGTYIVKGKDGLVRKINVR